VHSVQEAHEASQRRDYAALGVGRPGVGYRQIETLATGVK
jgi:hypothetical protein